MFVLTLPFRFAIFHISARLFRREVLASLRLRESSFDFVRDLLLVFAEPLLTGVQNFQGLG